MAGFRYLFGPVTTAFADQNLAAARESRSCITFSAEPGADITIGPGASWEDVCQRFPADWQPDFIALHLQYTTTPECLWSAPVPIVGLAGDWNLLWHHFRRCLRRCEFILTDTTGVEVLQREGIDHARVANLFGCGRSFLETPTEGPERDIDVLFVGNLHPAVQRERMRWLGRLARLRDRYRVEIHAGIFGADYQKLLRRARIVFNRSIRGECNQRAFEATACGALLFQEAGNREMPHFFREGEEYVSYADDSLEERLCYYLDHEDDRGRIAEAGRCRTQSYSFDKMWDQHVQLIEGELPALQNRAAQRRQPDRTGELLESASQALGGPLDPSLLARLETGCQDQPRRAELHNARGLVTALAGLPTQQAAACFQEAWICDPRCIVAGLNLAEALTSLNRTDAAVKQARQCLAVLDWLPADAISMNDGHFPTQFDHFRVEWERAAWSHAGDPQGETHAKRELIRWQLHTLLARLTGDLVHYEEAAALRPDLPATRAALGCALGRVSRLSEALPHLRFAVEGNPFDGPAAQALFQVLLSLGDGSGQSVLARNRRLLCQAAPAAVKEESWFAEIGRSQSTNRSEPALEPCEIAWEGPQAAVHSLALVNREICLRLIGRGHHLGLLIPQGANDAAEERVSLPESLAERYHQPLSKAVDIHVRHQWPPDFTRPNAGRLVIMQPWEFGSIPRAWIRPMTDHVDEVWTYTNFVRDCYVKSGVPANKVHVVPLGVDAATFRPEATPLSLDTKKRFKFLFVGGTIWRKGIDVLLHAYGRAFSDRDDVCLVIKEMGKGTFYRGQTAEQRIAEFRGRSHAPEIEYIERTLSTEELAGLYTACDCLVHPYRGEGFGLPIAEAMASGLPIIVTGYGAALDYCDDRHGYLLPAREQRFPNKRVGDIETVDYPWLAEPDPVALTGILRHVVEHSDEARRKGAAGSAQIQSHYTWEHAARAVEQRLQVLRGTEASNDAITEDKPILVTASRPKVSLCLIVKNEEDNLPDCLGSVQDLVGEIIVVDTGSTDKTKEVAQRFGARVFDFPWVDSFSAARNESIRHASGEWVFWMDADDRLDAENRDRLRTLFTSLGDENAAYDMKCLCLPDPVTQAATVVDHIRLFRNHPSIRWEHRVHEQILPSVRRLKGVVKWADVVIQHLGYQDPALRRRKLDRDLRLLQMEYAEQPDHPFTLFNLASVNQELGQIKEAIPLLRRSLETSAAGDSIVRKLYSMLVLCHRQLGQLQDALTMVRVGREYCPDDAELLYQEARVLHGLNDFAGAEDCLKRLLSSKEGHHFASVDPALRSYRSRHYLGLVYMDQKRYRDAEEQFQTALAENPSHVAALIGLGDIYVHEMRLAELKGVIDKLESLQPESIDGRILKARACLAGREFAKAKELFQTLIADAPNAVYPRVLLTHVLLQDGRDWAGAEEALRDVLELDPNHAEAKSNLEVLLRQRHVA